MRCLHPKTRNPDKRCQNSALFLFCRAHWEVIGRSIMTGPGLLSLTGLTLGLVNMLGFRVTLVGCILCGLALCVSCRPMRSFLSLRAVGTVSVVVLLATINVKIWNLLPRGSSFDWQPANNQEGDMDSGTDSAHILPRESGSDGSWGCYQVTDRTEFEFGVMTYCNGSLVSEQWTTIGQETEPVPDAGLSGRPSTPQRQHSG